MFFKTIGQKILFLIDPEKAHSLAIQALKSGFFCSRTRPCDPRLKVNFCGLEFPNPLGMAAGFDKNAEVPDALFNLGFGFVEVGTLTPLPQPGNSGTRIFRLENDEALINRLGFNNKGHSAALAELTKRKKNKGILGVNLGANKKSSDPIADYELGIERFSSVADYLTINISSPNTPGLRDLHNKDMLPKLLSRLVETRNRCVAEKNPVPLFLKISPDLLEEDIQNLAMEIKEKKIDGIIVSNTTVNYPLLKTPIPKTYTGGLSGKPLFARSTALLARMRFLLGDSFPIISVGGVDSVETALEKIRAGANAIQLYTGLIYNGPSLPERIIGGILEKLDQKGLYSLCSLRSKNIDYWLNQPL